MRCRATSLAIVNQGGGGYVAADADARTYIAAVEAADGQPLENAVRQALDVLFQGVKSDYGSLAVWHQLCLIAGPRTVAGGMVPLAGTAPTAVNFVSGDINRRTGWLGDGTTKAIDTNVAGTTLAQNNAAAFLWVTEAGNTAATRVLIGNSVATGGVALSTIASNTLLRARMQNTTLDDLASQGTTTGLKGMSRSASGSYTLRSGGSNNTITRTSEAPASQRLAVFAIDGGARTSPWNGRAAAWGMSTAINLALIEARLQTYLDALVAAGI